VYNRLKRSAIRDHEDAEQTDPVLLLDRL
jgi:hypothetical protein